jgi:hypothetical protein
MTRKDSEKDSERPHYYSQFWLDVAAGRKVIGTSKTNEEVEPVDIEMPELVSQRKSGRTNGYEEFSDTHAASNERSEAIMHPVAEPIATPEEFIEPEDDDLVADDAEDLMLQQAMVEDHDIPDMDLSAIDEEEDLFEEEADEDEAEEDEEDIGWGGRGRKKGKPIRPVKQPPKKPGRREQRRPGY